MAIPLPLVQCRGASLLHDEIVGTFPDGGEGSAIGPVASMPTVACAAQDTTASENCAMQIKVIQVA